MTTSSETERTDADEAELVAVDGTLMRGFENHERAAIVSCAFLGECEIPGVLYDCGSYPGLKLDGDGSVDGELYRCPQDVLRRLDRIEGATGNDPLFTRREIELADPDESEWV